MKTNCQIRCVLLLLLASSGSVLVAAPLGTAFTYQGKLTDGGQLANGSYDFRFTVYDDASGGGLVVGPVTNIAVGVINGLFTASLDFGAGVFTGDARWLEIGVRTNGTGPFAAFPVRQQVTPAPQALYAPLAGSAAAVAGNSITAGGLSTPAAPLDGQVLTFNGLSLAWSDPATTANAWLLGGNMGTTPGTHFLGTTDNRPVEIRANNNRVLRLEPDPVNDAPNVIAGSRSNTVAPGVVGAVIAGGGRAIQPNRALGDWSVIGGGEMNVVSNHYDVVSGGTGNTAGGGFSAVGGGSGNIAYNLVLGRATVAGGMDNRALGQAATVAGGRDNAATNSYAAVPGGQNNLAGGQDSFAAGRRAKALHDGAFVWADATDADFASTKTNQLLIRASSGVGIGTNNPQSALHVAGTVTATSFSGSGTSLTGLSASQLSSGVIPDARLSANVSLLGGSIESSEITDGTLTAADVQANTFWKSTGNSGTAAGTHFLGTTDNQPVEFKVNGLRALRLEDNGDSDDTGSDPDGAPNVIGGAPCNWVAPGVVGATISGGGKMYQGGYTVPNWIEANFATIGGGYFNSIQPNAAHTAIAGGYANTIQTNAAGATIGGGASNTIQTNATYATIAGGRGNTIQPDAFSATIAGGVYNTIQTNAGLAAIGGGRENTIRFNADYATIAGGRLNTIQTSAAYATIAGGEKNLIHSNSLYATIGGGYFNEIEPSAEYATLGGGYCNWINSNADNVTIGGGYQNWIREDADDATIGGGIWNEILSGATYATIGGGFANTIQNNAMHATIAGGCQNSATEYAFAAGRRAKANHAGSFVWADAQNADFASTRSNQFNVRATGGVRMDTGASPGVSLNAADRALLTCGWDPFTSGPHAGVGRWGLFMEPHTLTLGMPALGGKTVDVVKYNADSTSTWLATFDQSGNLVVAGTVLGISDREAKENFTPLDNSEVLEKVVALPISRWNFKADTQTPHVGPMAQDFHAAFGLGMDDKHIATVDADGVALAAIQGLNRKLEAENAELKRRLERLEQIVQGITK